nr:beta-eliminating lyase-related protein [Planctomycetota bacterium]
MDTTKRVLDFRSDTVTRPHEAMRAAMAAAVVGDDVLGDDPTVKELERRFAATLGKEAALFCPSGSMCNLIALCIWTRPGDEVVMEERTHTFVYEGAGSARFAHVQTRTFARASGVPEVED